MSDQIALEKIERVEREANVSLRDFFAAQIVSLERRTEQTDRNARAALEKAEKALERRLDLLNEFRAQSSDEAKRYMTRDVYDEKHDALIDRVTKAEHQISRLYGGILAVGAIGIANLVKLWFSHV